VENMINSTKERERACIEKVRGALSFSLFFHLSFAASCQLLVFCGSLILDDHF
jgi:hypothetical protein